MSLPYFIAKKYLFSKKDSKLISVISVICIAGISLGVVVLIIALNVLDGFDKVISEKTISFESHIYINGFGGKELTDDYSQTSELIKKTIGSDISSISRFVSKPVMIRSKLNHDGILLKGINYDLKNPINNTIILGKFSFLTSNNVDGIIIGNKLAQRLSVKIGDKLIAYALPENNLPDVDTPIGIKQFSVTGIYESGMAKYDDLIAYIDFNVSKDLFQMNNGISGYNIRLTNLNNLNKHAEKLQDELGYPYHVKTFKQVHQQIFDWIALQKGYIPIALGLLIIVAVFNIIATLLMIVMEKIRAIGILKSLGTKNNDILMVFLFQGMIISLIGIFIGNILAFILSYLQLHYHVITLPADVYFVSFAPITLAPESFIIVSVAAFILSILAAIIPSFIASRITPIASLRFN